MAFLNNENIKIIANKFIVPYRESRIKSACYGTISWRRILYNKQQG
jgi:hypothetical protein